MPQHSLRFAHASQLRLDSPLRGVGPLTSAARRIVEDAPLIAWRRLVDACIERDVQFLLLTPRTIAASLSLRDRHALRAGVQRLAEAGIAVYWRLCSDEEELLAHCGALAEHVTWLSPASRTATFLRHGRVAATIDCDESADTLLRPEGSSVAADRPLRIRILENGSAADAGPARELEGTNLSADYVAAWGNARPHTESVGASLRVDPGTPLGRSADETGGGGVTIVDWVPGAAAEIERVPTASVHWERIPLGLTPETQRDELIERLQYALLEREPAIGEQLWIIDWQIVGSGPLFGQLQEEATRTTIERAIDAALGDGERLVRVHRWKLTPRLASRAGDDVGARLQEWLVTQGAAAWPAVSADLQTALRERTTAPVEYAPHLRFDQVRDDAQRLLTEWLSASAGNAEGGSRA